MRKLLLIILGLILISVGVYYFLIYKDYNFSEKLSPSSFLSKLNFLENNEVVKKTENVGEAANNLKEKVSGLFAGLSKTFSSTVQKVSSTVSVFDSEVKDNKLVKLISVLDGKSGSVSTTTSSGLEKEVGVCINFNLDQQIVYLVENPFTAASSTYLIDWGDGSIDKNVFTTSTAQVSHVYVNSGEFTTKFKVESGESFAEVSRMVCVK